MSTFRTKRICELLLSFLGERIATSRTEDLRLVTLTGAEVTGDLRHATLYWVVPTLYEIEGSYEDYHSRSNPPQAEIYAKLLEEEVPRLRRAIGAELNLRVVPELHFKMDRSAKEGARIDFLLHKLRGEDHRKCCEDSTGDALDIGGNSAGECDRSIDAIAEVIKSNSTFLITHHESPDPDAIGSSFALAHGLASLGKSVAMILRDAPPAKMEGLLGDVRVISLDSDGLVNGERPETVDVLIVLDTANSERVNGKTSVLLSLARMTVNIDHHISNSRWADYNLVDGRVASCAQIVLELVEALECNIDATISNLLYAGLVDDSGRFCFSSTSQREFQDAAKLVTYGAQPFLVSSVLYYSLPLQTLRIKSIAVEKLKLHYDGALATVIITEDDLVRVTARGEDCEGVIDEVRSLGGTKVVALARQAGSYWKVSLRSKDLAIDVNEIAKTFNGGGHKAAAGCRLTGSAEDIEIALVNAMACIFVGDNQLNQKETLARARSSTEHEI